MDEVIADIKEYVESAFKYSIEKNVIKATIEKWQQK